MILLIEFGKAEVKHYPAPFSGVGAAIRCWVAETNGSSKRVELPEVRLLSMVSGSRVSSRDELFRMMAKARMLGWPTELAVSFAYGSMRFPAGDWNVLGGECIDGEVVAHQSLALTAGGAP